MPSSATLTHSYGDSDRPGESPAAPTPPAGPARYALGAEIARGGMGVVYQATDTALGRKVAVKVLQERYGPDSGTARRFADEARITGQLQHPGIPAVHDLGVLPDGRPFLAMKLVNGDTLDDLLKTRPDPAADRGQYVAAFEQVCQAVAYAHSRDVIHRDLKPANVMVGAFGEVQVMDWGLAKVLAAGDRPADADPEATGATTEILSLRGSDGSFTQAGSVLGTPAFMSPEQALGAVTEIDARSDVFGLGGILAVILTGIPPFAAGSAEATRIQAAQGKLAGCFARLDASGADPELVALCKRCLAPERAARPADAGGVAAAVAALRQAADERARRAELDRVRAEGEAAAADLRTAEQRKRRRVQAVLGLAFTALVVLGGAFAGWARDQARTRQAERAARQSRTAAGVSTNLREARDRATEAWSLVEYPERIEAVTAAAVAAVGRADRYATDGEPAPEVAADLAATRAEVDDLARHARLLVAVARNRDELAESFRSPDLVASHREALTHFGFDPLTAPEAQVARLVGTSRIRDALLGVFLEMQHHARTKQMVEAGAIDRLTRATRLHIGGPHARWQELLERRDTPGLVALSRAPEVLPLGGWLLMRLSTDLVSAGEGGAARDLLRAAVDRYPHEPWLHFDLRYACHTTQPPAQQEALRHAAAAATLRPTSGFMRLQLAQAYELAGDSGAAIEERRAAARLSRPGPAAKGDAKAKPDDQAAKPAQTPALSKRGLGLQVGADPQSRWVYDTGQFEQIQGTEWQEVQSDGSFAEFTETERSSDYVEIRRAHRATFAYVKIYDDHCMYKLMGEKYRLLYSGVWR